MKRFSIVIIPILLLGGLAAYGALKYAERRAKPINDFRTARIQYGDVVSGIGATGTLEPEEVVDVGAQVAGLILSFGKDAKGNPIDYGSHVERGTVLANIDTSLYASDVAQSQAALAQARANVQRAEADLGQMRAKLEQAAADWKRAQELGPSDALAQSSYDAYKAAYETAKANLDVGQAAIIQNQAAVVQAQAGLDRAQRNLGYCTIVSPVEGVIIDRRVNIGQTVVSSLNAPSLFLIAKDLRRMQVWASVNEADVGNIRPGQRVTFTVDALPGQTFTGSVAKIRLNAAMTQNVVTYTVEVTADNSQRKLLPYLTANVQFEIARREHVLTVPNAALRWSPRPGRIAGQPATQSGAAQGPGSDWSDGGPSQESSPETDLSRTTPLWIKGPRGVQPLQVHAGLSDGIVTEVYGNGLKAGMDVIIGEPQGEGPAPSANTNPFAPHINRGRPDARSGG